MVYTVSPSCCYYPLAYCNPGSYINCFCCGYGCPSSICLCPYIRAKNCRDLRLCRPWGR
uniref:Uncharacterized protein n=1 Tax=Anopheles minimus TaxID=112268 RepID=A0A182WN55_9DIPT